MSNIIAEPVGEEVEVVGYIQPDGIVFGAYTNPNEADEPLMTVAQHKRIAGELRAELDKAMKVPSVAAMHTWLDGECAMQNKELAAERDQLKAAVPAGYVMVPVEPTPEMVDAADQAYMPFGDMKLAVMLANLVPAVPKG